MELQQIVICVLWSYMLSAAMEAQQIVVNLYR
jgi:hypothetical protein